MDCSSNISYHMDEDDGKQEERVLRMVSIGKILFGGVMIGIAALLIPGTPVFPDEIPVGLWGMYLIFSGLGASPPPMRYSQPR